MCGLHAIEGFTLQLIVFVSVELAHGRSWPVLLGDSRPQFAVMGDMSNYTMWRTKRNIMPQISYGPS